MLRPSVIIRNPPFQSPVWPGVWPTLEILQHMGPGWTLDRNRNFLIYNYSGPLFSSRKVWIFSWHFYRNPGAGSLVPN